MIAGMLFGKIKQAEEANRHIELYLHGLFKKTVTPETEWIEAIGILLDNAIEANGRIPEKERKELSFWIEEDSDSCTVKLRNALASKEVFNLSTWKTDGAEHGVGTKIIRAIVEKYHGTSKTFWDKERHSLEQTIVFSIEHPTEKREKE